MPPARSWVLALALILCGYATLYAACVLATIVS
jgi:hypothetical protein